MGDRHERILLLAHQRIFYHHPEIGSRLLLEAGSARALYGSRGEGLRPRFGERESLWLSFRGLRDTARAEEEARRIEARGLEVLGVCDARYPGLLRQIAQPPPVIVCSGRSLEALSTPAVAMVGSRRASRQGLSTAFEIARGLGELGYTIVSGMAYGIDSASHKGALASGAPTVAVTACGADIVYPPGNAELASRIAGAGLVITEFPLGEEPFRSNFPQRNRIISGLALATVIVEAAERSGSLITARYALEQDREVLAVPGQGGSVAARGVNRLIRDGAALIECADDVDDVVKPLLSGRGYPKRTGQLKNDVDMDQALLRAVPGRGSKSVDELVAESGLGASRVLAALTRLAVEGAVEEAAPRRWRRTRGDRCLTR